MACFLPDLFAPLSPISFLLPLHTSTFSYLFCRYISLSLLSQVSNHFIQDPFLHYSSFLKPPPPGILTANNSLSQLWFISTTGNAKLDPAPPPRPFQKGTQTHPAELRFRGKHSEPLSPRQTRAQRHTATCSETKHVSMPDPLHSLTLRTDPQTQSGTYTRSLPCLAIIWNIFWGKTLCSKEGLLQGFFPPQSC